MVTCRIRRIFQISVWYKYILQCGVMHPHVMIELMHLHDLQVDIRMIHHSRDLIELRSITYRRLSLGSVWEREACCSTVCMRLTSNLLIAIVKVGVSLDSFEITVMV